MIDQLESISCQLSELESLLEIIHDSATHTARTGGLVSLAERVSHLLQNDVIALIAVCHQQAAQAAEGGNHE
jgi:hypothetical protein